MNGLNVGRIGLSSISAMHIRIVTPGKTQINALRTLIDERLQRLQHYTKVNYLELAQGKLKSIQDPIQQVKVEGELMLTQLQPGDWLILLDERGKTLTSEQLAQQLEQKMVQSVQRVVFFIGGAYGFSPAVYDRANQQWALSAMTFTHEQARLLLAEQLYRAFTILRHEPYHH